MQRSCSKQGEPTFAQRALELKSKGVAGIIAAGESYGQGSSREHAALCPMHLGVRVVIAKSIERIHKANLINFCIVPLEFTDPADYDKIEPDDELVIDGLLEAIENSDKVKIAKTDGSGRLVRVRRQVRTIRQGQRDSALRGPAELCRRENQ